MNRLSLRQQEIIETALEIIADKGIENFTIKNLAGARGVSEPSLYRHFDSKENILLLLISQHKNSILDLLDRLIDSETSSFVKIESFYLEIIHRFSDKPALSTILFSDELFRHNKNLSKEIYSIIEMMHGRIEAILKTARRRKELMIEVPNKDIAWIIMGTMRLLIVRWRFSGYAYNPAAECKAMLKSLKRAFFINN